jgi:lysophospholipase L1-like esterase
MIELAQQNAGTAGSGIAGCLARPLHFRKPRFQTNPCLRRLSKLGSSAGLLAPCLALLAGSGLLFAQTADMLRTAMPGPSIEGSITILDQAGRVNTVPGVLVNLTASASTTSLSTASDIEGHYRFTNLPPGSYRLDARLDGFTPFTESVALNPGEAKVQDVRLELAAVVQKIDVQDQAPPVAAEAANSASTLSSPQLTTLPLAEQKFKAALPLVPGVVRTREGQLNFKGAPESQAMLLVDSAQTVDPVTGGFSIPVPLDAIATMTVEKAPYSAEYGGFSGGLTSIETKAPFSNWNYGLMDFIPGARAKGGHLVGLSNFTPRLFFGGPLIKDKLNFLADITYDINKTPVRGLPWPNDERKKQGYNAFTSLQALLSPQHVLSVSLNGFSSRTRFADIDALVPESASADDGLRGVSVGANDSYQFSSGAMLTTVLRYTRFDSNAHGQGPEDMLITPDGWGGNFFNAWTRNSNHVQFQPLYQLPAKEWYGRHELKVGVGFSYRAYNGTDYSHPIELFRQDGSLAERIDFQGGGPLHGRDADVAEFVQDHWTLTGRLALDLGARLSTQSLGTKAGFAPRAALVFSPTEDHKTIIRAGAGFFYDRVSLLATDFLQDPTRVASFYDPTGTLIGSTTYQNSYLAMEPGGESVPVHGLDKSPRNTTYNFEVDRELVRNAAIRVNYLYSRTKDLYMVTPLAATSGNPALLGMTDTAGSHYHELEATLHYRLREQTDFNVSYIHSRARGDLNSLSSVYVPFEQPVIRPDVYGTLPQDMPDRVVGWGILPLPHGIRVSPAVDVHTGLPYSNTDVLQNYVGAPDSQRFPTFFSLDVKVYREFQVRLPFSGKKRTTRKIRFGLYSINLTNHANPLEVYTNITSPVFGHFVGFQHRVEGFVLDAVN